MRPMGYHYQNGRSYHEAITAVWQLRDVDGVSGFACIPGSHHANHPTPAALCTMEHDPHDLVRLGLGRILALHYRSSTLYRIT